MEHVGKIMLALTKHYSIVLLILFDLHTPLVWLLTLNGICEIKEEGFVNYVAQIQLSATYLNSI